MTARFERRWILLPLSIGALPCLAITLTPSVSRSTAYEPRQERKKDAGPNYPRVNLATTYEVDPHWPKRPSHFEWGHVPGIAVDRQDRVYLFTRAVPPVQLYDADGNFLRAWGEAEIKTAHHIKVGPTVRSGSPTSGITWSCSSRPREGCSGPWGPRARPARIRP